MKHFQSMDPNQDHQLSSASIETQHQFHRTSYDTNTVDPLQTYTFCAPTPDVSQILPDQTSGSSAHPVNEGPIPPAVAQTIQPFYFQTNTAPPPAQQQQQPSHALQLDQPPPPKRSKIFNRTVGVIGADLNGLQIIRAVTSRDISVLVYDQTTRVQEDISRVKHVDTPADLARETQIIFLSVSDPSTKHDIIVGKDGVFKKCTKRTCIIDVTNSAEFYNAVFSQYCRDKGVHLLNAPFHGLRNTGHVKLLLASGSYEAYAASMFALQAVAKTTVFLDDNPLSAPRVTTIVSIVTAAKVLLIAEAISLTSQLGLNVNIESLIEQNDQDLSAMVHAMYHQVTKAAPMRENIASHCQADSRLCLMLADSKCVSLPLMASSYEIMKSHVRQAQINSTTQNERQ